MRHRGAPSDTGFALSDTWDALFREAEVPALYLLTRAQRRTSHEQIVGRAQKRLAAARRRGAAKPSGKCGGTGGSPLGSTYRASFTRLRTRLRAAFEFTPRRRTSGQSAALSQPRCAATWRARRQRPLSGSASAWLRLRDSSPTPESPSSCRSACTSAMSPAHPTQDTHGCVWTVPEQDMCVIYLERDTEI